MNIKITDLKKGQWIFLKKDKQVFACLKGINNSKVLDQTKNNQINLIDFDKNGKIICFLLK